MTATRGVALFILEELFMTLATTERVLSDKNLETLRLAGNPFRNYFRAQSR